ncbi:hypothetical protein ACTFSP_04005 [Bacillus cereus group sp. MYBK108-2]|uniref:hypothetical protein n=1 Tax=unclassified Bacillus cereus group TaxID=2750818 RepID=UPI002890CD53|nr:hypothetical protein [Bacillus cereus]HEF1897796.1 hypothetical protein [Bacillus cereus]
MVTYLFIIILIVAIITCAYIYIKIKKNQDFTASIMSGSEFRKKINDYTGYAICSDRESFIHDFNLFIELLNIINKERRCVLVDLSNDTHDSSELNMELIKMLDISFIPSIIYMKNGKELKEIIHFGEFEENFNNQEILVELKKRLGQD